MARLVPSSVAPLAVVGAALIAAFLLSRPEPVPAALAPPPRSAAAQAIDREPVGEVEAPGEAGGEAEATDEPIRGRSLSRLELETGLLKVRTQALACRGEAPPPVVVLRIAIAPSGQVLQVGLPPEVKGTRAGDCIARAIRGASFPSWNAPPVPQLEWTYPLRFEAAE